MYRDGDPAVYRGLSAPALDTFRRLAATRLFEQATRTGQLVETHEVTEAEAKGLERGPWAGLLRHARIPFISYAYEWCFSMLKDAALQQLRLLLSALDEDFILKDATPYNTQWVGSRPVFIDIASFEPLGPGEAWTGYRQFCELFLFPLLLCAHRDVPFQPMLRGRLDGIDVQTMSHLLPLSSWMKPGVLADVFLHAWLERSSGRSRESARQTLKDAGFRKDMIRNNVLRLQGLVERLRWKSRATTWSDYPAATEALYGPEGLEKKQAFVSQVAGMRERGLSWDLGCNDGTFSRLVAAHAAMVVAMDADHLVIENFYRRLREEGHARILPLVASVTDPPPRLGWRGLERKSLDERGKPDLVLALALLHHLVIGGNVPLPEVIEWLRGLGGEVVLEFVTRADPQVQGLLRNKDDHYEDYQQDVFERCLGSVFEVVRREEVRAERRYLYHARPR